MSLLYDSAALVGSISTATPSITRLVDASQVTTLSNDVQQNDISSSVLDSQILTANSTTSDNDLIGSFSDSQVVQTLTFSSASSSSATPSTASKVSQNEANSRANTKYGIIIGTLLFCCTVFGM